MLDAARPATHPFNDPGASAETDGYAGRIVDYGPLPLADWIAGWASVIPDAPAIEQDGATLSYADLLRRVERCARWMGGKGVVRGDIVALRMDRSPQLVIAMLAAWRTGAAFLPMDPSWPAKRIRSVLDDAKPALIVHADPELTAEDQAFSELAAAGADGEPMGGGSLGDLAYVLYTSGSTGTPKGVMVEHRQVLNYALAVSEALRLRESRRWGALGSLAVDLGYTSVFGALLNGGCLVLASAAEARDGPAFARFVRDREIDCMKIVPSHLEALLDGDGTVLPRTLILGGEPTSRALLERIWKIAPDCRIYNHYGPTETTVGIMVHEADARADTGAVLPLSNVLSNCRLLVLSDELRSVPVGELGEVYVGGAQVCRGYMGGANAGVFVEDPYRPGERLYRTGDLAYRLPCGAIRLAGRVDHQVKVLGFRVEPAEIEAELLEQSGVRQAAVVSRQVDGAGVQLVAFIVTDAPEGADRRRRALRDTLMNNLPAHMVPSIYVLLDEFPRLPSGKIDRLALAAWPVRVRVIEMPGDAVEFVVARCMAELLNLDAVAADDDFFELGGHSLKAIKLVARIRKHLGVAISPAAVFDHSTPSALARVVRDACVDNEALGRRAASYRQEIEQAKSGESSLKLDVVEPDAMELDAAERSA